jgi:hypothetical protein
MRNAYKIVAGKPEKNRVLEKDIRGWILRK